MNEPIEQRLEIQESLDGTWVKESCFGVEQLEIAKEKLSWLKKRHEDEERRLVHVKVFEIKS